MQIVELRKIAGLEAAIMDIARHVLCAITEKTVSADDLAFRLVVEYYLLNLLPDTLPYEE